MHESSLMTKVVALARVVRSWAERHAKEVTKNCSRNYDAEGNLWLDVDPETLEGLCAYASAVLHYVLKHYGEDATFASNRRHAFVVVDGWVVDITATQFNSYEGPLLEPVTIMHLGHLPGGRLARVWDVENIAAECDDVWTFHGPEGEEPWSYEQFFRSKKGRNRVFREALAYVRKELEVLA